MAHANYRVPSTSGGSVPADPIKFCLRFRPPTIAIVYQLKQGKKYVREFGIELSKGCDLKKVCDDLFQREKSYFNPQKISPVQVIELLQKLHAQVYPSGPNKENAMKKEEPPKDKPKATVLGSSLNHKEDEYEDEPWEADESKEKKKPNPFDQKVKSAFDDLDDDFNLGGGFDPVPKAGRPQLAELSKQKKDSDNGLIVDNDFADEFDDDDEDEAGKAPEPEKKKKAEEEEDQEKLIQE